LRPQLHQISSKCFARGKTRGARRSRQSKPSTISGLDDSRSFPLVLSLSVLQASVFLAPLISPASFHTVFLESLTDGLRSTHIEPASSPILFSSPKTPCAAIFPPPPRSSIDLLLPIFSYASLPCELFAPHYPFLSFFFSSIVPRRRSRSFA